MELGMGERTAAALPAAPGGNATDQSIRFPRLPEGPLPNLFVSSAPQSSRHGPHCIPRPPRRCPHQRVQRPSRRRRPGHLGQCLC